MGHECPDWRGEIGAYIVGALDEPAATAVAGHIAICAGCCAEYDELVSVRSWLSKLVTAGPCSPSHDRPCSVPYWYRN